jgi:Xaa-Pro aminopeptidase
MRTENLLMFADSERDADMLYAVEMLVPTPFIYVRLDGRCHVVLNDLDVARGRRLAPHCRVVPLARCLRQLRRLDGRPTGIAHVIHLLTRARRIKKLWVPASFPYGLARELRTLKLRVKVKPGAFFPQREFKAPAEVKKISAALLMAEVGMAEGIHALRQCRIGSGRKLLYHNVPLTSEKLRSIIDVAIIQAGGLACHTIVAGGRQACDPHEPGYGPLRANQPIVLDIFPRSQKTGYFGDITRTVVRGRASEALRKLFAAVRAAQDLAFGQLRPKARGSQVHRSVQEFFEHQGYKTSRHNGRMQGFFHGTGHGLGLEIHEAPRLSATSPDVLKPGHVVTVEPGLYYPGVGAVRLEDVALVTTNGPRNLTKFEKTLEL